MDPLNNFLEFDLPNILEEAESLFNKPSPEERPFDFKYRSREILETLLKDSFFVLDPLNPDLQLLKAYVTYLLGINYIETEETSQGETLFRSSLALFSEVSGIRAQGFLNVIQDLYNNLGFLLINREDIEQGMGCLNKAEDLYFSIKGRDENLFITMRSFLQNRLKSEGGRFEFFRGFGINKAKTESLYTLTLFYLAQAYTKVEQKEKAAFYCGNTMKRQYETKEYVLKEWCVNAISLAEFYQGNKNFAQAFYLLQAGDSMIPNGKKKKLKATFQMSLARLFNEMLKYMVIHFESLPNDPTLLPMINKKHLIFESFPVSFIEFEAPKDYEGIAKIFRLSNTQYKKALGYFVLDGYVTENVEMSQEMSEMMKNLYLIEPDANRRLALLEKRKDLLEPLQKQLNPKAYPAFYQKLLVELAEIYNEMFENRFQEYFIKSEIRPKKNKLDAMNMYGYKSIENYENIEKILVEQQKEEKDSLTKDHLQSRINTRFNMAKAYNKIYAVDKRIKVELMKKSLDNYKFIVEFIKGLLKNKGNLEWDFSEQLKICQEMVELIPSKIDKINNE